MIARLLRLAKDERVRFLVVGGISAAVTYGLFVLFQVFLGRMIGYFGSLYASYVLGVLLAFVLHRRVTFRAHRTGGSVVIDFVRFSSIYVVALIVNSVGLPLLVEVGHLTPIVAQAIVVVLTPLITYTGHKYFSFARRSDSQPSSRDAGVTARTVDTASSAPAASGVEDHPSLD